MVVIASTGPGHAAGESHGRDPWYLRIYPLVDARVKLGNLDTLVTAPSDVIAGAVVEETLRVSAI